MTQPRITSMAIVALLLALAIVAQFHRAETHARTQAIAREKNVRAMADLAHEHAMKQVIARLLTIETRLTAGETRATGR